MQRFRGKALALRFGISAIPRLAGPKIGRVSLGAYPATRAFAFSTSTSLREVQYTAEKYPGIKRDPKYKELAQEDVQYFESILSPSAIIYDSASDLHAFNTDWMNKYRGKTRLVLKPKSAQEVSDILKYCNEKRLAVVPQGGNTGLVGGSIPVFDEIVISTQNMNKVRTFDEVSGALVADAGCVLEALDNYLAERGYMMPLDLGAKGSCHIGGNVATNAGGLRLLRYGSLHGTVLGLEVVLPDGTILDNLSTLRKDNTGYDLKQLFIGSEGTLGIITGVSILAPRKAKSINVACLGVNSYEGVQTIFKQARTDLSEILSAFEFWDKDCLRLVKKHEIPGAKDPMEGEEHPFYVLIETAGSNKDHDDEKLSNFLEQLLQSETIPNGVLAQDASQIASLWSIREGITEALSKNGATYKYDISMPVSKIYECVQDMRERLTQAGVYQADNQGKVLEVVGYGHIGDGNLHLNVSAKSYDEEVANLIEPYVFEWVAKQKGSISAEHGLGLQKPKFLHYSKSQPMIHLMHKIKDVIDPNAIMNPYKYLPAKVQDSGVAGGIGEAR